MPEEKLVSSKPETLSSEKPVSPALQELKKLVGPVNIRIVNETYTTLSPEFQEVLLQKIKENQENIEGFADDDTSMATLLKEIIQEVMIKKEALRVKGNLKMEEKKIELEKEAKTLKGEKVGEKGEKIKEVMKEEEVKKETNDEREKIFKEALTQRDKAYAIFGGEQEFKNEFKAQLGGWESSAKEEILKESKRSGIELSGQALQDQIDISVLVSHRDEIASNLSKEKRSAFTQIIGQLEQSAKELRIPIIPSTLGTVDADKTIRTELVGLKPTDRVTRIGNEFRYGDQVVDMSTNPPTRSTEQNGIRIMSTDKDGRRQEQKRKYYEQMESFHDEGVNYKKELEGIRGAVSGELKYLNKISVDVLHIGNIEKLDGASYDTILRALGKELEGVDKNSLQYKSINDLGTQVLKRKQEYQEKGGLKEQQERIPNILRNLSAIEQNQKNYKEQFQKLLEQESEFHRGNLRFLASTHLDTILGQSGIDALIRSSNAHMDSFTKIPVTERLDIELGVAWTDVPHKQLLAEAIERLTGSKLFKRNNGSDSLGHPIEIERIIKEGPRSGENVDAAYIRSKLGLEQGKTLDIGKIESSITQGTEKDTQKKDTKENTENQK